MFSHLSCVELRAVIVHSVLGIEERDFRDLTTWIKSKKSTFFAHDFHSICPRVTMISSLGTFCGGPKNDDVCERCVRLGGPHSSSSKLRDGILGFRRHWASFFNAVSNIVAPSENAASYIRTVHGGKNILSCPNLEPDELQDVVHESARSTNIILLGAIGPHKGSKRLFDLASYCSVYAPEYRFHVIGYTDEDKKFDALENVHISGPFTHSQLPSLIKTANGRIALFLNEWPETYSFTLSESVRMGLIPVVPDIGAPADRVRSSKWGCIYPFPSDSSKILAAILEAESVRGDAKALLRRDRAADRKLRRALYLGPPASD